MSPAVATTTISTGGRNRPDERKPGRGGKFRVFGLTSRLDDITLYGRNLKADLNDVLLSGTLSRTIEGASTVTLDLYDEDKRIMNSKLLTRRSVIELDNLFFALVAIDKQGKQLTLTFEDIEVWWMRMFFGPKKAYRGKITRAQFIHSFLRDIYKTKGIRIGWYSPEENIKQEVAPIENMRDHRRSQKDESGQRGAPGFGRKDVGKIVLQDIYGNTVKADLTQIHNIDVVLDTGMSLGMPYKVLWAAVTTAMEESLFRNLGAGSSDLDSHGLFQQRPAAGWNSSTDVAVQAREFFLGGPGDGAIDYYRRDKNISVGELCQSVQASGYPDRFAKVAAAAKRVLDQYLGAAKAGDATGTTVEQTVIKPYAFQVAKKENYWTAAGRLAEEVQWRRFIVAGTLFYLSETRLFMDEARMSISEDSPGVEQINYNYDSGKRVTELSITARSKNWAAPPGTIIEVEGEGDAVDGRYLISTIEAPLLDEDIKEVTITAKKPMKPLSEPAPETETKSISVPGSGDDADGAGGGAGAEKWFNNQGTPEDVVNRVITFAHTELGFPQTRSSVRAANAVHGPTSSGGTSDHQGPPNIRWAADISNGWTTPEETHLAAAIAKGFGAPWSGSGLIEFDIGNGMRCQLIYKYVDHYDHVHFGCALG